MTMTEFNNLMRSLDLKYSVMVCFDLGTAAYFGQQVLYWQRQLNSLSLKLKHDKSVGYRKVKCRYEKNLDRAQHSLLKAQHNALASGMFEKDNGLIFEPLIEGYSLSDLTTINNAIRQWQPIVKVYGVTLTTY